MIFFFFFNKRRKCNSHFEVQLIKRTKRKNKHVLTTMSSPYVIFFFEAENVLKEETKKQISQTYFSNNVQRQESVSY